VRIYRLEGGQEVTISVLEAGEMFGEAAFTSREGKGSYAQAIATSKIAFLNARPSTGSSRESLNWA
jgi:CRP-like cAMP-binding protein